MFHYFREKDKTRIFEEKFNVEVQDYAIKWTRANSEIENM